jgi:endonuclease YncB( thermonuclease family)
MRRILALGLLLGFVTLLTGGSEIVHAQFGFQLAVAKIINVLDGDTFDVEYISGGDELPTRIQTYAINTPDYFAGAAFSPPFIECYGEESAEIAEGLLMNRTVWIRHQEATVEFAFIERLLALIYLDADEISLYQGIAMSQGIAVRDLTLPEEQFLFPRLIQLEQEAEEADRGIWGVCPHFFFQDR